MGAATYTVKRVADSPREWSGKGGPMLSYTVDFEGEDGKVDAGVEWARKPESRAPAEGDRVVGSIAPGRFSDKFTMDFEATKELGGGQRTGSAGSSNFKSGGKSPDQQASIVRQHSQEMALRAFAAWTSDPGFAEGAEKASMVDYLDSEVRPVIDWFEADANAAQAASGAGGGTPSATVHHPAPPQKDEEHWQLTELLEKQGLDGVGAPLLANFALSDCDEKKRTELVSALGDEARKDKAVDWLRGQYEGKHGTLPEGEEDGSDIPF